MMVSGETSQLKQVNESANIESTCKQPEKQSSFAIPGNPLVWNEYQVYKWMTWVGKGCGCDTSSVQNHHIDGKTLCKMTLNDFVSRFPFGQTLYNNLELLKKLEEHRFVITEDIETTSDKITIHEQPNTAANSSSYVRKATETAEEPPSKVSGLDDTCIQCLSNKGSGPNGQIQLWQFLLEILTDADCVEYIQWIGDSGEFKFLNPSKVAQLWGIRKNKPAMNYEKLARALRYYYDGEILSKVAGKRFAYKFVCDLKELVGFTAAELNRQVQDCAQRRRNAAQQSQNVDAYLRTPKESSVFQETSC